MNTTRVILLTDEYMHADAKTGAQALHLAIAYHAAHVADAVAWADALIGAVESPPDEIVAISLAGRLQSGAVIDLLSAVPGIPNRQQVAVIVLGYISRALNSHSVSGGEAAAALEHMAMNGWVPSNEAQAAMYTFDDHWRLAEQGCYGWSTEDVRSDIAAFIDKYSV